MEEILRITENKAKEIVSDLLFEFQKVDAVQDAIYNLLEAPVEEKVNSKLATMCTELQNLLTEAGAQDPANNSAVNNTQDSTSNTKHDISPRIQNVGIHTLVNAVAICNNSAKAKILCTLLNHLSSTNTVSPKLVCTILLNHEKLKPDHSVFWLSAFNLVKRIISGVDYKGVREIMKACLERTTMFPVHLKHSQLPLMDALCEVMELIFDRNASLLPGYFIVNELLKLSSAYTHCTHWRLSRLITDFIDNFRMAAQMLSIVGRTKLRPIIECSIVSNSPSVKAWKLDSMHLKIPLKGTLPYWQEIFEPQTAFLKYVMRQPYSREMLLSVLDLQKKQPTPSYTVLEEQLIDLIILCVEECSRLEQSNNPSYIDHYPCCCHHVTSLFFCFFLQNQLLFNNIVKALNTKLKDKPTPAGRHHLMWILLQLSSFTIAKKAFSEIRPILKLIEILYPEKEALPVPDFNSAQFVIHMSATCILIHCMRKAQVENLKIPYALPPAFTSHYELIQNLNVNAQISSLASTCITSSPPDFRISVFLNAYSTNSELFQRLAFSPLFDAIQDSQKTTIPMPGMNCVALGSTNPVPMVLLDSFTLHVKNTLLTAIAQYIGKQIHYKTNIALSPTLIETYSRLFVYTELEVLSIKYFTSQLLGLVFKGSAWGILHALLEMFVCRIHHCLPEYRIQLLSTIHHMAVPLTTMPHLTQLYMSLESTALSIITGLGSSEILPCLPKFFGANSKLNVISAESEELNRVLVLTLARAIHITGCEESAEYPKLCVDFMNAVMSQTPHTWTTHTLMYFPPIIADFYKQHSSSRGVPNLKKAVEEEYRKWKSMSNENDIIAHFSVQHNTSSLFLCLLFKMVLEMDRVPIEAYKVLERVVPKQLMTHVRTLCDFLVLEFCNSQQREHLLKCVEAINAIIWQYKIVPFDCLMLCLVLRTQEANNEVQVWVFIIQLVLHSPELQKRVQEFVTSNSPEHWKQNNWYEMHMTFHRKYPEKFAAENVLAGQGGISHNQTLPIYFSNVCIRFLAVLDIIIHRILEVEVIQVHKRLESILERLGILYKFHHKPITYLYNTLHYYEELLRDNPSLKRHLVNAIIMSQQDIRRSGWALTDDYIKYINSPPEDNVWEPPLPYYSSIVRRLVHTVQGKPRFPDIEWRFNEFANSGDHAIHVTCVELMALPVAPATVGNMLFDVIIKAYCEIPVHEIEEWINAIGLIFSWLPEAYWSVVHNRIILMLQHPELKAPPSGISNPFILLNLKELLACNSCLSPCLTLAICHSFWQHGSCRQLSKIPYLMKDKIRPVLETEEQLIFLFHLVGPFLQRLHAELQRQSFAVITEFYEALFKVDQNVADLKYQDAICDILYHIKYMFTGDSIKNELTAIIKGFKPSLQLRLRFIAHLNVEAIENQANPGSNTVSASVRAPTPVTQSAPANSVNNNIVVAGASTMVAPPAASTCGNVGGMQQMM